MSTPGRLALAALLLIGGPVGASAEAGAAAATGGRALVAAEAEAYRGVGRLEVVGIGACTATLISERLVVTAAHCLFNGQTARPASPGALRFFPGGRPGERSAALRVVRTAVAPGFALVRGSPDARAVADDLALLELAEPAGAGALEVAPRLGRGGAAIVAHSRSRGIPPTIRDDCPVRALFTGVAILGCTVPIGTSGAPVVENGRLAAIVSASGIDPSGAAITLAAVLGPQLAALEATLGGE